MDLPKKDDLEPSAPDNNTPPSYTSGISTTELFNRAINDDEWKIKQIQECVELLIGEKSDNFLCENNIIITKKLIILQDIEIMDLFVKNYNFPLIDIVRELSFTKLKSLLDWNDSKLFLLFSKRGYFKN